MKKIIILGKSSAGKTTLNFFLEKNKKLKSAILTTSRPIRPFEKEGIHYYFITDDEFQTKINNNEFITYKKFNNWNYGLTRKEFDESDIIVIDPTNLKEILKVYERSCLFIIFLEASYELRKKRSLERGDNISEINRRNETDTIDFKEIIENEIWDIKIDQKTENSLSLLIT